MTGVRSSRQLAIPDAFLILRASMLSRSVVQKAITPEASWYLLCKADL
jgi:hypothetical protein